MVGRAQELLEKVVRAVDAWQVVFGRIRGRVKSACVLSVFRRARSLDLEWQGIRAMAVQGARKCGQKRAFEGAPVLLQRTRVAKGAFPARGWRSCIMRSGVLCLVARHAGAGNKERVDFQPRWKEKL